MKSSHILPVLGCTVFLGVSSLSAESFSTVEYVNVTKSTPIYSTVQEEVMSEKCYDVQQQVSAGGSNNADVVGAVAGGAIGGVLGHQVGKGKGNTVATIGGAVIGTLVGQNVGSQYTTTSQPAYQTVRRCEPVKSYRTRQIMQGYTNVAKFKGHEISIESDQPIKQIPVTVTYSY